jgi:membrane fusion protein (multidrug efflux system)
MAKAGQVLVELDTSVERAQLNTALVQKELAEKNAVRSQDLFARGVTTQAELDSAQSALQGAEAQVATLRAQIARKIVRAPFRGKLGIRAVNLGQYLAPGTTISTLEALDSVYVDFTLPQQTLESLSTGLPVRISLDEGNLQAEGQIAAISPSLDASTRSVRVRAAVPNIKGQLRPGMFATVSVVLPERTSKRVAIPITALVRAPYGDSVFIVGPAKASAGATENTATPVRTARQQFVRVGPEQGDFVAVLDGVKAGEEVVTEGAFKLRNGANVTVHNEVRPEPEVHPHPDNH